MVLLSAMSTSEVGSLISSVRWADEGSYVKEVIESGGLPKIAKVIKGQYLNIGVPFLASPNFASTVLLLSGGSSLRISAQCVKFYKEGRRVVAVGPKLAIPESYDGYFEILSEDGKAVRCMETVYELFRRFPDSCLVRESLKVFVSRSDNVETITERSRTVKAGETLVLVGEVTGSKTEKPQQKFLRCFDQSGQNVYLPLDGKGKFSAVAKEDNISGVHTIKNLLNKRLPLMVRLIHGQSPVGSKATQFLPELRLFAAFSEEALAALPLGKDLPLILVPPSTPLKFTQAKNFELLNKSREFLKLCDKATTVLQELSEKIYPYDISIGFKSSSNIKDFRFAHLPDPSKSRYKHSHSSRPQKHKSANDRAKHREKGEILDEYDEIDEIYDYVRGFAPLPRHIKYNNVCAPEKVITPSKITVHSRVNEKMEVFKPVPPPIETIPSRRLSASVHPALISAVIEKAERKYDKADGKLENHYNLGKILDINPEKIENSNSDKNKNCNTERIQNYSIEKIQNYNVEKNEIDTNKKKLKKITEMKTIENVVQLKNNQNSIKSPNSDLKPSKLFIKSSNQKSNKSKLFRHKSSSPIKENILDIVSNSPTGGIAPSLSLSHVSGGKNSICGSTPSPLFKLRYKSLTNLAIDNKNHAIEFDTLDSSTSGGRYSTDSYGSIALLNKIPDKREKISRKLRRPKSLTSLVFDNRRNSLVRDKLINNGVSPTKNEVQKRHRLDPGVYRHGKEAPALLAATTRLLASQKKKIGTFYL